ncbi:PREDICTED: disease resistance protein RPS5-like [Tarenaya hassleriana]|uniref:disease resistance protein RPS5-like n=1 Tax=Tarenaya hassleriana TaxID=28532 RepID=UPI00053C3FFA|nr:PREDICTED: disease resistance protein RPS5-like [Tarenaya hassleriana]
MVRRIVAALSRPFMLGVEFEVLVGSGFDGKVRVGSVEVFSVAIDSKDWLSRVQTIENQVHALLDAREAQIQQLCLSGYCSKKFVSSYRYSKKIFKMCKVVDDLISSGAFDVVTQIRPPPRVEMIPTEPMVDREAKLAMAWGHLRNDHVGIFGLYGMGGVGKTTLLKHINRKFHEEGNDFDIVIWIVVSRDVQILKIQEEIGEKLGLNDEGWKQQTQTRWAIDIYNALREKRFVLLLDDLWSKVNLTEIGVPSPNGTNRCKVIFTTRSREVCGSMEADDEMEVQCLSRDDALTLFREKVKNVLESERDIPNLAEKVARECQGLPLALNVVGDAMARKRTVEEWYYAINVLESSNAKLKGMKDKILSILKYSYDDLMRNPLGEKIQLCFLYCALFPEDYRISKGFLVDCWIGERLIDRDGDIKKVQYQGYSIIGTLVNASLLIEEGKDFVKMHDVVREMALWVACDTGKEEETFFIKAGANLHEMPKIKNQNNVRRMSLMCNRIQKISGGPQYSKLKTLFLRDNKLVELSDDFFQFMQGLICLDLSVNIDLNELPESISKLVSLRFLNLSLTKIKRLPDGLKELNRLIYLNLEGTFELENIHGISSLWRLRILRLVGSKARIDVDTVDELQLLHHLSVLTISICDHCAVERLVRNVSFVRCIRTLNLEDFSQEIEIEISTWWLRNLREVTIFNCGGIKDLTWLQYAPYLTSLWVSRCGKLEEIIREEKAGNGAWKPFHRLECLGLEDLPELKSIYWSALSFPCLSFIRVHNCPTLRKTRLDGSLPLDLETFQIDADVDRQKINLRIDTYGEHLASTSEVESRTPSLIISCVELPDIARLHSGMDIPQRFRGTESEMSTIH